MIAVTGATGHVGARVLRALEEDGREVRAVVRSPEKLDDTNGDVAQADVQDETALRAALEGADTAYYLVHSLGASGSFADEELRGAETFGAVARDVGVDRIVYLGGLVSSDGDDVSDHMASRRAVGAALEQSGVPTVELRASIVIGAGSLSFETIRFLVDTLPVLTLPGWVKNLCQPIAADDVVAYLVEAADAEPGVYEVGGADRVTYLDVMEEYARQAGLKRRFVTFPAPPRLLSLSDLPDAFTGLSPEKALAAAQLIESLEHDSIVRDDTARERFAVEPVGLEEAVRRALAE